MGVNEKRILKTYFNMVKDIYDGTYTSVKSICGETEGFRVRVGVL